MNIAEVTREDEQVVGPWHRHNFLIFHFGRFDTKRESFACQSGISTALGWDGDSVDEVLDVIRIVIGWDEKELAAFKSGFEETRKYRHRLPEFDGERVPPRLGSKEWRKSRKKFLSCRP